MIFSYNWLQSFFPKKIPKPENLAKLLTLHFAEVEEIKKEGKDFILDIDVRPNRAPDCFSHLGVAREIAAILGYRLQIIGDRLLEDKKLKAKDFISVEVKDKNACLRYTARVLTNVKVGPSPKWLKDRLGVCGLRPINNIVDIANYVMIETGQPLHAFDGDRLEGKKIIVRFAKKREKIVTLDTRARQSRAKGEDEAIASSPEEKYDLNENILVIADAKRPVAIAGIKGGLIAGIDRKTKVVVLESANFNPQIIRQGSRKLSLKTDAALRFEHGIDPNLTEIAINRATYLIQKIAGGKTTQGLIDFYPKKVLPKRIKLNFDYIEGILGMKIPQTKIRNILKNLGFGIVEVKPQQLTVEIPTRRLDISLPEDLIEEIGRIFGYQKIPSVFPVASLVPAKRNLEIFWEDNVKNILKEVGFSEVYNYSFISEKEAKIFGYEKDLVDGRRNLFLRPSSRTSPLGRVRKNFNSFGFASARVIEVENPVSVEQKYLRPSLIPNLLKNIQKNQRHFDEIKIFELGKIFQASKIEKRQLTGVITGEAFYQLKGVIDLLLGKLGISNIWYDSYQPTPEESKISIWHPKKCTEIKINGDEIGFLGEISPKILEDSEIGKKVVIFDLDFEKLSKLCSEEHEYRPISRFPAAVRDLAVLVPRMVKVEEVLNKIEVAAGVLVRDIDLFDIYEGEEIPRGKKNLAFHLVYQAEDRTLSSKEIDEIQNKIIKTLEEEPEWEVRK